MLTSDLIQMLLDAQKQAEEEVEIRGALINNEDGLKRFHQVTIVGVQLFHVPDTDEQHVKLIFHEQPNLNGDKILAEIKDMVSSGHQWSDKRYFTSEG